MNSIVIEETKQHITVEETNETLSIIEENLGLIEVGIQGPPGVTPETADKHFEAILNGETDITITHNLDKRAVVTVIDSAGTQVEGTYQYLNNNQVRLMFTAGFGGKAVFN